MARSPYAGDFPPGYFSSQPVSFSDHSAEAMAHDRRYVYDDGRLQEYPVHPIESSPANLAHPSRNSYHWNDITGQFPYDGRGRLHGNARHDCFDVPDGPGNVWSARLPVAQPQHHAGGDAPSRLPTVIDAWRLAETPALGAADNPTGRITHVAPWVESYDHSYTCLGTNLNSTFNTVPDRIRDQPPMPSAFMPSMHTEVLPDYLNGGYASSPYGTLSSGSSSASHGAGDAPQNERDVANLRRRGREEKVIAERRKHPATHICPECSADFTTNSARNKHVDSQHRLQTFSCQRCAKRYAHDSSLGRHIRTKHSK